MNDPALDPATLEALGQLNQPGEPDVLVEALTLFRKGAPAKIAAIEAALQQQDAAALQRAAHELKGATGTIGALGLQHSCRELETIGKSGALDGARAIFAALNAEFARVEAQIDRLLRTSR